nr:MAG TPA: Oxidoreductase-like protein [Caudoviricetes sp.]
MITDFPNDSSVSSVNRYPSSPCQEDCCMSPCS